MINISQRTLACNHSAIHDLLTTLGTKQDTLWPHANWPAMKFKTPPAVGAVGGHGPIPYRISIYQPASHIRFDFAGLGGINGFHEFLLTEQNTNQCTLTHRVEAKLSVLGFFKWHLVIAPLHDALLQDLLDQLQNTIEGSQHKTPWPWRVRFIRKVLFANHSRLAAAN